MKILKYIVCIALFMGFVGVASNAQAQTSIPLNRVLCCGINVSGYEGECLNLRADMIMGDCVEVADETGAVTKECQLKPPFQRAAEDLNENDCDYVHGE